MKILAYPFLAIASITSTLLVYLLSPILYFFADSNGYLPRWLEWAGTPDTPVWGDVTYGENQGKGKSLYIRSVMWICRNPAQGMDQLLGADYGRAPVVCWGNPRISDVGGVSGWMLAYLAGYFHLLIIAPVGFGLCVRIEAGWRIQQIACDYESGMKNPNTRQLVAWPIRIYRFGER